MANELKPCPNCGGQAKLHKKGNKFYVECDGDCWTQTDKHSCPENAVKEWNGLERRKEEKTLLPCPFCGKASQLIVKPHIPASGGFDYTPRCSDPSCPGRITKKWNNKDTAIYAWNRRCNDGI